MRFRSKSPTKEERAKLEKETADQLEMAFSKLDATTEKLETLKKAFHGAARELEDISKTVAEAPVRNSGVYSITSPVKPQIPRPGPKPKEPQPSSKKSGRFYIQINNADETEELRAIKEKVSMLGRVVDSGTGTASNPSAGWVELAVRGEDISALISQLKKIELQESVEKVIEIEPGEGQMQSRQLNLPKAWRE